MEMCYYNEVHKIERAKKISSSVKQLFIWQTQ